MGRPKGETPPPPTRGIRVSDELWEAAGRVCEDRGSSRNAEIVKFLERLVARHPLPPEK